MSLSDAFPPAVLATAAPARCELDDAAVIAADHTDPDLATAVHVLAFPPERKALWPSDGNPSSKLFIRECYTPLWTSIASLLGPRQRVYLTGTQGIGKSCFVGLRCGNSCGFTNGKS